MIQAVVVATPLSTHYDLARQALLSGKDVLVEKPMTKTSAEGESLLQIARKTGRIVAVDHTFLFSAAVRKIKHLVSDGAPGKLRYIDSVRTHAGVFHNDHNVIYDLAPHEISIVLHLVERDPISVQAHGACHMNNGIANLAYVHLEFEDDLIAHFHLNWQSPVKIRQMIVAGSQQMIVYDDSQPSDKVKIYNKEIPVRQSDRGDTAFRAVNDDRADDMVSPHLENREPLAVEAAHFVDCVRTRQTPLVSGEDGLRVVRLIEAAQRSLNNNGQKVNAQHNKRLFRAA